MNAPGGDYLRLAAADRGVLKFLTCGSVDDGKSTLIGRLLHDTRRILEDQLSALERDSRRHGTTGDDVDLALLLDGLEAEREQGITIDVAHRYFATGVRAFVVADTPGHEQYTRNMATGASNSDLAIVLVDARKGVLAQTRRHSCICDLLGIRHIVLAVNKMDLVEFSEARFAAIDAEYRAFAAGLHFSSIIAIPISARDGANVVARSASMPWHDGPTLLEHLETVDTRRDRNAGPMRMPVQWVNRPNVDYRGYCGTLVNGVLRVGDRVVVARSAAQSHVKAIVTADGDLESASAGDVVTVLLDDEIDISRGDLLAHPTALPLVADQFRARVLWMDEDPMLPGRSYLIKAGTATVSASFTSLRQKLDIPTLEWRAAKTLTANEIGECNVATATPLAFDPYSGIRETGAFIVIDRVSLRTAGAGMIEFPLNRATNVHRHEGLVDRDQRAALKGQRPRVVWFTGLSGAGKSTVASLVERKLVVMGTHTMLVDGDNLRHGLSRDLGFSEVERVENIRRAGEVARLMADAGLVVLCSFISPFRAERRMVRDLMPANEFVEVFVDTPLDVCEARDPKGLYAKARAGTIANFTGVDSAYERPEAAELTLRGDLFDPETLADQVVAYLELHR